MDRRLFGCGWAALLLHGSLLAVDSVRPAPRHQATAGAAETDIDLLPIAREELPIPAPLPTLERATRIEPAIAIARRTPKRMPRAAALDGVVAASESELAAQPAASDTPEQRPGEPAAPGKRLSLGNLGLTGTSSALLPPPTNDMAGRADGDVGGLNQAMRARDIELGLGPGGAVAAQVRLSAQDLAPLSSEATLSVDLASDGSIDTVFLEGSRSHEGEWRKVIRALRERVGKQFVARGGPVRVTLLVTCRSATRSGGAQGAFSFDVSNIGSPTMRSVHIRVLRQDPL